MALAYLSRETVKWLKIWLKHAKIGEGPIFRRLIGRDQIGDVLHAGSIAPIFKRVAQWIGMPARFVAEVSGHSTRVGAAPVDNDEGIVEPCVGKTCNASIIRSCASAGTANLKNGV